MGFQNIAEAGGIGLAVTGMTIVFVALVFVSLFITALPRVLPLINALLPVAEGHHGVPTASVAAGGSVPAVTDSVSEELVAAIGFTLHRHQGE